MLTVLTSACSFVFCESLPLVTPLKGDLPEERAQDGPRVLPEWRRSGSCRLFVLYFAHLLAHLLTNTGYPLFGGHYSAPAGLQPGLGHRHPPPQSLRSRHCLSPRGSQRSFGNINQSGRVTLSHTSRGSGDLPAARRALCPLAWGPPPLHWPPSHPARNPPANDLQFLLMGMLFPPGSAQRGLPTLHTAPPNQLHGS